MAQNIYRKEAIEYKKYHWKGKALLLAGMPAWLITLLACTFLIVLIFMLIFLTIPSALMCMVKSSRYRTPSTFLLRNRVLSLSNLLTSVML